MPTINGTSGNDLLTGTSGADAINGLEGIDQLVGNGGGDTLSGGDGNDWLHAGAITGEFERPFFGNNPEFVSPTLDTGSEIDTLNGGAGLDTIFAGYGDIVDGGADLANLLISLMGASSGVTVDFRNLDNGGSLTIGGGSITNIQSVTWIEGSNYADVITGSDLGSYYAPIFGRGGNDQITAGGNTGNIYGGDGNDTIVSAYNSGYYYGEAGDDTITATGVQTAAFGGDGNDTLNVAGGADGGAGNDIINTAGSNSFGNDGDDILTGSGTLIGGHGADTITGDDGNNFLFSDGTANAGWPGIGWEEQVDAGTEHDVLSGGGGNDTLYAGYGDDVDGGTGINTLALSLIGASSGVTLNVTSLTSGSPYVLGGGTIQHIQNVTGLWGSNFGDTLTLAGSMDVYGMGGNDTINGTGLEDRIHGGAGSDIINAGAGNDFIYLDSFDDAGAGEQINGGDGFDSLIAIGQPGLPDGTYYDISGTTLTGIERLAVQGPAQVALTAAQLVGITTLAADLVFTTGGNVSLDGISAEYSVSFLLNDAGNQLDLRGFIANGFVIVAGGSGSDVVLGTASGDNVYGNAGNDRLYGKAGSDNLVGGDGNDTLDGGTGSDSLSGGKGNDIYYVDDALDSIAETAGEGTDKVFSSVSFTLTDGLENLTLLGTGAINGFGNTSDNLIDGNDAANNLYSYEGNDTLNGGGGNDYLSGGAGNDNLSGGTGNDLIQGSTGDDFIDGGADTDTATYALASAGVTINLSISGAQNSVGAGIDTITSIENLIGSNFADTLRGDALANSLSGGNGDDRLLGGAGNDTLSGGAGYDRLYGGTGDDIYTVTDDTDFAYENWGEGTDQVNASVSHQLRDNVENLTLTGTANLIGEGNELANIITGNSGANKLYGFGGADTLNGQAGDDYLLGGDGSDALTGGAGVDRMYGGTGDDGYYVNDATDYVYENADEGIDAVISTVSYTLRANVEVLILEGGGAINGTGNELSNDIYGNDAANVLSGRAGDDGLRGGAGDDRLAGGDGNDWIEGGAGRDRLSGEAGADSFIFNDGDFAGLTNSTCDQIYDFSQLDGDKIDLGDVDANTGVADDQDFTFIGTGNFTGMAGELRYYQANGQTYVQGDTNGDGVGDFLIRLDGLHDLQVGDFVI